MALVDLKLLFRWAHKYVYIFLGVCFVAVAGRITFSGLFLKPANGEIINHAHDTNMNFMILDGLLFHINLFTK